jgi:hypothetical protein
MGAGFQQKMMRPQISTTTDPIPDPVCLRSRLSGSVAPVFSDKGHGNDRAGRSLRANPN